MKYTIQASKFKSECLKIMNEVQTKKHTIIITKGNKPVAQLIPIGGPENQLLFGKMKNTAYIKGDIIQSIEEKWDACS